MRNVPTVAAGIVIVLFAAVIGLVYWKNTRYTPEELRHQFKVVSETRSQYPPAEKHETEGDETVQTDETTTTAPEDEPDTQSFPDVFQVEFECSNGTFVAEFYKEWAPRGAGRVYELVRTGFFDDARFFRVIEGFMAQFGISGDPLVNIAWADKQLIDDPVKESNKRGYITFAKTSAPNSRSTQLFINLVDNPRVDDMGFAPVGRVIDGMDVVDGLYSGYGEGAPRGKGPAQNLIQRDGNMYLKGLFPKLDYIKQAAIVPPLETKETDRNEADQPPEGEG